MKHYLIGLIALLSFSNIVAQDSNTLHKKITLGLGGVYSLHQDNRYSAVQYIGAGTVINLGSSRTTKKRISSTQFLLQNSTERPATFSDQDVFSSNVHFSLFYRYLYRINEKHSIGGRMELINGYFRNTQNLSNNSSNFLVGNCWYISGHTQKELKKELTLNGFIDFVLFSIQKGSTGFGFSTPHRIIKNGKFNYQDGFDNPANPKGYGVDPFWKSLTIKTSLILTYQDKVSLGYDWRFKRFIATQSYPIYTASHALTIYYNIYNKKKNR